MSMAIYLIKTALCLTLFYLAYRALLNNKCHFTINRIYLIGTFVLSFIFPLITINIPLITISGISAGNYSLQANAGPIQEAGRIIVSNADAETNLNRINPFFMISILYFTGILIFTIRYGLDILRLIRMIRKNRKQHFKSYTLVTTNSAMAPFSFFRYVFVSFQDLASGDFQSFILKHELAHIRAWHSLDRLFLGLGQIIQWFNPVTLFYKKAIVALHEFSADCAVIDNAENIAGYQQRIMQYSYEKNNIVLTSQLSDTITKKRFNMMKQQNSGRLNAFRAFIAAVVAAFMLLAFSSGDKILVKSSSENTFQNSLPTATDENNMLVATTSKDTTETSQQQKNDTAAVQSIKEDENIRILSDELRGMMQERRPDSGFLRPHHEPLRDLEMLQRHMARKQAYMADRQRHFSELQRHAAEQERLRAEHLKALTEKQLHHLDAEQLKKMAEDQARIEALKPGLDEFLKRNPPLPGPFILDENCLKMGELQPFIDNHMKNFSFPHPDQFELLGHLNEADKEMLEKQKQWQEKYSREMEKQQKQLENKRKQLLEEYHQFMKKYRPEE